MPTHHPPKTKVCRICRQDCSDRQRTKDRAGNYYCKGCYEQAMQQRRQGNTAPKKQAPKPTPAPLPATQDDSLGLLSDLAAQQATAPTLKPAADACEHCGEPLSPGAALCVSCGFNRATGQRIQPAALPIAEQTGDGSAASRVIEILKQPWMAFVVPTVVLGILFVIATADAESALIYQGPQAIFGLVVGVLVLVQAFREGIGTGLLTFFVPFYVLYYVYAVNENPYIKSLFGVAILAAIGGELLSAFQTQPGV